MDPAEYLAIVPLLIYGIGITDLLGQWKRIFNKDGRFPLYIIYTIILTEVAIYNVVIYITSFSQNQSQLNHKCQ